MLQLTYDLRSLSDASIFLAIKKKNIYIYIYISQQYYQWRKYKPEIKSKVKLVKTFQDNMAIILDDGIAGENGNFTKE